MGCVCVSVFQSVGGSLWNGWKTLAWRTKTVWKNCGCVKRRQTARTPALRSNYSQDTGAEDQYSPSHTPCETVDDCLYNQLIRRSCMSICASMCSQYLETVLKIPRRDVCLAQLIIYVRENTLAHSTLETLKTSKHSHQSQ